MDVKETQLCAWHQQHGATLAEFGGYRMPLWYSSGPIREHRAVITGAGLFDTSHMAEILVEGPNAEALLQRALTKDLNCCIAKSHPLEPGRATYGFLLNDSGHVIDDAIVMMEEAGRYLLVVNAGMGATATRHLLELGEELDITVSDPTDRLSKVDLQGPAAASILKKVLQPSPKLNAPFPYFSFAGHYDHLQRGVKSTRGFSVMVSRTGYTGEFGFELFVRPADFASLWQQILEAGDELGLLPCGLGARDSLRTGAMLPLSHQDIGDWPCIHHPWSFALPWRNGKFSKSFTGDQALLDVKSTAAHTFAFLGENGRKVSLNADVLLEGDRIGNVLSCATDMAIDLVDGQVLSLSSPGCTSEFNPRGLSCGFVRVERVLSAGQLLTLKDKRREISVRVVNDIRPHRSARMAWPL